VGEALGSSGPSEPVTRATWEAALSDRGVFFRYDAPLPGEVFARWLGTEIGGATGLMQQVFLSARTDAVYLYHTGADGLPYRSPTAVRPEDLLATLAAYQPNGARFGFLDPAYTGPNPDAILLVDYSDFPVIRSENAAGGVYAQERAFLEGLGLNPALIRSLDEHGTRTIVEGGATVVIHEHRLITYHCQSENPRLAIEGVRGPAEVLDLARRIAQTLHLTSGEAEVYLTNWFYTDGHPSGQIVYQFSYFIDGVPIWTESPAATVVVTGRYVTEVTLFARAFYRTEQTAPMMPEIQAAAASGGVPLRLTFAAASGAEGPESGETVELRTRWLLAEGHHG